MDLIEEMEERKEVVEQRMEEIFRKERAHPLWEYMFYYPESGGKKLRPFLAMITAEAFGESKNKALPYGISLELVHNFTLVHDDIMDQDDLRRGKPTLHQKIGDAEAINAGDGLFALSFNILSQTDVEGEKIRRLLEELSSSILKIAEGQEEDMRFEDTFEIREEDFIQMIKKKTAYLFSAATRGGTMIADCDDKEIERMGNFAKKMGIAFQIQDDYLDLVGDEDKIGKDVGSDIKEGKRTLMVIKALSELPERKKDRLIEILEEDNDQEDIKEAMDLMRDARAIEYSKNLAKTYAEEAKSELEIVPDPEYRSILEEVVDFVISREK
ncbi:MAG: polyprenyl synthetase family protein [Candidatus Thermoplasmatota archaeon]|nr:polyprenyl synthetase family protein [Candidatus Thermoplasmatota archaeon]MBS3789297.1 polyprenyl synthetase family protein [Candidatus Thermoplasmatota archaeon]